MVMLGIVFIIFLGAYALSISQQRSLIASENEIKEWEECLLFVNSIVAVYELEQNAQMIVTIGHNFTIIPAERRMESAQSICTLPIGSVSNSGSPVTNAFTITPGEVIISKEEWVAVYNG